MSFLERALEKLSKTDAEIVKRLQDLADITHVIAKKVNDLEMLVAILKSKKEE